MSKKKLLYISLLIILFVIIGIFVSKLGIKKLEKDNDSTSSKAFNDVEDPIVPEEVIADMDNVIDIKEKMFIQQLNDIYINSNQYNGKTVRLEGFMYHYEDSNKTYYYVMRNAPGCCGDDGSAGLEIAWNNEYPSDNEWVEATGVIKLVNANGYSGKVPVLYLTNLDVKQERGADFVIQ